MIADAINGQDLMSMLRPCPMLFGKMSELHPQAAIGEGSGEVIVQGPGRNALVNGLECLAGLLNRLQADLGQQIVVEGCVDAECIFAGMVCKANREGEGMYDEF